MYPNEIAEILLTEDEIHLRVKALGQEISRDYSGKDLVLIGILKGAFIFLSDLVRHIEIPITIDFVAISSYGQSTKSSGIVKLVKDLDESVENKHVLLVEDIVDTGWTLRLSYIVENLYARKAASVRVCTLLDKPTRRKVEVPLDYIGFEIPDRFVVGYGLDYRGYYRNLPYIGVLNEDHLLESQE